MALLFECPRPGFLAGDVGWVLCATQILLDLRQTGATLDSAPKSDAPRTLILPLSHLPRRILFASPARRRRHGRFSCLVSQITKFSTLWEDRRLPNLCIKKLR